MDNTLPTRIYLGLGSNIGNRLFCLERAVVILSHSLGRDPICSSVIETAPWGYESDKMFLNQVVSYETLLSPCQLLALTRDIEIELGRQHKSVDGKYSDRPIDIDILFYGDEIINSPDLIIPHPLLHEREFVLSPLVEIAKDKIHPVLKLTTLELLQRILSMR